jgi:hypothetical protein
MTEKRLDFPVISLVTELNVPILPCLRSSTTDLQSDAISVKQDLLLSQELHDMQWLCKVGDSVYNQN